MDPASILGLISSAGTIASTITKTIRNLSDLKATYAESNVRIRLLIKELSTIKSSLTQINDWAHFLDETDNQADLKEALQVALDGVDLAMGALAEEVQGLVQGATPTSHVQLGFREKTKYAWSEANMKEHENRLRAQVSALQLLLQAAQCPSKPEQAAFLKAPQSRQIIQKVAEDTMTLRNSLSVAGSQGGPPTILSHDDSTIDEKVFDIDDEIVNSATYRRALHHNASKRNMGDKLPPQPRSSNVEIHVGSDDGRDDFTPTPSPTPSKEARPLPYENSVFSEPVDVYSPGKHAYIPLSSRSDVAPERDRPLAHRFRSSELGKRTFWSSLTPKRSSRQVNSPTVTASSPNTSSSSLVPGFQRGRRGFENSSHASIDFGSESGLSAPSIVRAAQAGSVMEVEMLLNQDCDVDAAHQQSGRTALAVASHCGNQRVVQLLLQYGANVNTRDASSFSPLHLAAMRGHYQVIELLLQEHVKVDEPGPNDETPLRVAVDKGFLEVAALLLQTKAKVNARDKKRLRTPLHAAAINGHESMAELLIRHGAHIEAKDGELMAPIHLACEVGKDRIVNLLLNKKANPEALGRHGMTPIICAAAAGQVHMMEILLKKKASLKHQAEGDMSALHWAAYNSHDEACDFLLQKRAPIHMANKDGRTALHLSIMAGSFAIADLLLRRGAAVDGQCKARKTPILYACQENRPEIVQLLLGYHANPEAESSGRRPLHEVAARGLTSIANILLSRGVDIEARDADGERALGLACRMGHLAIARMLLDRGSRLRSKFAKGPSHEDSPLCLAARGGHLTIVQELISRGSSVLQKDEQNWSPLRYASYYAHPEVVKFLLQTGATVSGQPSSGWGFEITARRIGFADEVVGEENRKAQVLKLLVDAEAKERRSQEEQSATPPQGSSTFARSPMGSPAELGGLPDDSTQPQRTDLKQKAAKSQIEHAPHSELDTRVRSPSTSRLKTPQESASVYPAPSHKAAKSQFEYAPHWELDTHVRSPSTSRPKTPQESASAYPAPSHIANAYGFDPFPQQRGSIEEPRPSSATTRTPPAATSVVQIGPDGMWRLNPTPSLQAGDATTSIYEMGS